MKNKSINYSIEDSYEKLSAVLESFDLTYSDIKREFESPRLEPEKTNRLTYAHKIVLPSIMKIYPERIQNGSYSSDTPSLKAWFERGFRNSSIYEHLGDYDVIDAVQNDPNIQFDTNGKRIYLHEDGNHRLFNYLLLAIIDQKAAKFGKEVNESRERFAIRKPVNFEHPESLISAFNEYTEETFYSLPTNMQNHILNTPGMPDVSQSDFFEYNPISKTYALHIEGKAYTNLTAAEAENIIKTQPIIAKGVKIWKANNEFYISVHNIVYHTKDNKEFSKFVQHVHNNRPTTTPPYSEEYLLDSDLDSGLSSIKLTPRFYSQDTHPELTTDQIIKFNNYLYDNFSVFAEHLSHKDLQYFQNLVLTPNKPELEIPAIVFSELPPDKADEIEEIIINALHILNPDKKREYEQGDAY